MTAFNLYFRVIYLYTQKKWHTQQTRYPIKIRPHSSSAGYHHTPNHLGQEVQVPPSHFHDSSTRRVSCLLTLQHLWGSYSSAGPQHTLKWVQYQYPLRPRSPTAGALAANKVHMRMLKKDTVKQQIFSRYRSSVIPILAS